MPLLPPESPFDPYYWPLHVAMVALFGACFGSFFNVCIYRIPLGVPLSMPPSHCYRCGSRVRWYDNIPLLSYWILGGHCRSCGASFSMRYFLIELLTMGLFVAAAVTIGYSLALVPALILTSLLLIATFTDIDHWIIPDRINFGGLLAGLVLAAIPAIGLAAGNPLATGLSLPVPAALLPLANAVLGAAAGFVSLWLVGVLGSWIFRKDAMGFGDVKLFAMFGAFLGPEPLIYVLLIACLVGTAVGGLGILSARLARGIPAPAATAPLRLTADEVDALIGEEQQPDLPAGERAALAGMLNHPGAVGAIRHHLPFGPSLAIAAWVVYLWGGPLREWLNALVWRFSEWLWGM